MLEPTVRFSNRVSDYVKYRPGYPVELVEALRNQIGLQSNWKIADVGSGTGKLTELFLRAGCEVFGVEPNREMRLAAEESLMGFPRFVSVDATAEGTSLEGGSVELVTAGQAFHWFRPDETKAEFKRILKPGGWVALIWNDRKVHGSEFLDGYEALLNRFEEYRAVGHKTDAAMKVGEFFGQYQVWSMPTEQKFDWDGLRGRALSSSYVPAGDSPEREPFLTDLRALYDRTAVAGQARFLYQTEMFFGQL